MHPIKKKLLKFKSRIDRSTADRRKTNGEVFTPIPVVSKMCKPLLHRVTPESRVLDPACGNGNILAYLLWVKFRQLPKTRSNYRKCLNTVYGCDLQDDNCREAIYRLFSPLSKEVNIEKVVPSPPKPGLLYRYRVNGEIFPNIVCADGKLFDYNF